MGTQHSQALPGKQSWGKAGRSTPSGMLMSSVPSLSPSIRGLSLFLRKERLRGLARVARALLAPGPSSLQTNGGTNTDSTSGSSAEAACDPVFWAA